MTEHLKVAEYHHWQADAERAKYRGSPLTEGGDARALQSAMRHDRAASTAE